MTGQKPYSCDFYGYVLSFLFRSKRKKSYWFSKCWNPFIFFHIVW